MLVSSILLSFTQKISYVAIEGDKHNARSFGLARELVLRFARHHGKPAWAERTGGHALHFRLDGALDDDELFLRRVKMPRDKTIGRGFQDDGGRAFGRIAAFDRGGQALDVVILLELDC